MVARWCVVLTIVGGEDLAGGGYRWCVVLTIVGGENLAGGG